MAEVQPVGTIIGPRRQPEAMAATDTTAVTEVTEAMADTDTTADTEVTETMAARTVKASHRSYVTTISRYVIYETGNI